MRKTPRQARSRATVERIVEAGRQLLLDNGYDAFSTNRVAARAGVSPGSLYQYFPDKAAILDVVIDRYWGDVSARIAASLADRVSDTGAEMVRASADALVAALEQDRELLRVMAEELPVARNRDRLAALEVRVRELATTYLATHPGVSRSDPRIASWVLVMALEHLAVRWVLDRPALPRERLLDEIVALVGGYLTSGQARGSGRRGSTNADGSAEHGGTGHGGTA